MNRHIFREVRPSAQLLRQTLYHPSARLSLGKVCDTGIVAVISTTIVAAQEMRTRTKQEKQTREARAGKALEVDTKKSENGESREAETSWLGTLTPTTASTPTVMLQRDGPGEKAEPLRGDDPDGEEPSEEERETARRVFEG